MADASAYLRLPGESEDEHQARLMALAQASLGVDPAITSHSAFTSPARAGSPTPITDRRYVAPPEPTAENSGITDLADIEGVELPPHRPDRRMADANPYARLPGESEDEHRRRVQALYASDTGQSAIGTPEAGALTVPVADVPPIPRQGPSADARQLALQINPLEELERAREMVPPTHTDVGSRMTTEGGERPNMYGIEDEFGFNPFKQQQRARELYGQTASPSGQRWEDEYLANRKRYTDDDIQRGYMWQTLVNGPEAGMAFRKMARDEQGAYDKGLWEARDRDAGTQRVSTGLAEAIAASGLATPEAAVQLRMNDPLVKAYTSGGYSQGLRARGQDYGMGKTYITEAGKTERADNQIAANRENTLLRGALGVQAALANKGIITADTSVPDATKAQLAVADLMQQFPSLTVEQAVEALAGNTAGLPAEVQRDVTVALPGVKRTANDSTATRQRIVSMGKVQGEAAARRKNRVLESMELAQTDVDKRQKWQEDWTRARQEIGDAIEAWSQMSDDGKQQFVQWGKQGWGVPLGNAFTNAQDQALAGAVQMAVNAYIKANAGSAVTGSEWDRLADSMGIATGIWNPFNSTAKIEGFLDRSGRHLVQHRRLWESNHGGWDNPGNKYKVQ